MWWRDSFSESFVFERGTFDSSQPDATRKILAAIKTLVSAFAADNENDGSNCLPRPDDITLCNGPGGKCYDGLCRADFTDEGCPCGDQYACNADPAANSCINQDRPCICDGFGTCAVNYFPTLRLRQQ